MFGDVRLCKFAARSAGKTQAKHWLTRRNSAGIRAEKLGLDEKEVELCAVAENTNR